VIELVVCVLLVNWFLFYFNRLFATLISYGIRAYTWHKFRVWVDIQALQISLLGGRIFFKGIRYHGENESVFIQVGYVTWRYWLRSTRLVDLTEAQDQPSTKDSTEDDVSDTASDYVPNGTTNHHTTPARKENRSEARVAVTVTGLEWYVYNRTPVYDSIVESIKRSTAHTELPRHGKLSNRPISVSSTSPVYKNEDRTGLTTSLSGEPYAKKEAPAKASTEAVSRDSDADSTNVIRDEAPVSSLYTLILKLLPLGIECTKGAISLGNETTKAIVVTTFTKAKGHIDASRAEAQDIYRQIFDFEIEHPVVQMRPNPAYRQSQHTTAERVLRGLGSRRLTGGSSICVLSAADGSLLTSFVSSYQASRARWSLFVLSRVERIPRRHT
jgi:hypothetical protein